MFSTTSALNSKGPYGEEAITVFPKGGLGNQLFIYATGRALSVRLGVPLILDLSWFQYHSERKFELSSLVSQKYDVTTINSADKCWTEIGSISSRLYSAKERIRTCKKTVICEYGFQFDPRVMLVVPGESIVGYLQSWKYFDDYAESIREEIVSCFPSNTSDNMSLLQRQKDKELVIHVRLGDYTKGKTNSVHGVLPTEYYSRALNEVQKNMEVTKVSLLSDDSLQAMIMLENLPITHLEVRPNESAWQTLKIMSMSSALIMANSSLSWWGAWLGGIDKRLCLYPEPWFANGIDETSDLIPQGWVSIPRW